MVDYKVKFEIFEGPLDLLLYLVKKEEVDIYEVNLTKIAGEFIAYVDLMRELDLDLAGEFLVMAATLVYIKSRELLPTDLQSTVEGEEDELDPRWELIRRLVEYKKYKDAASRLQLRESEQENIFPRQPGKPVFEAPAEPQRLDVSLFDLIEAVNAILKRVQSKQVTEIYDDRWTVTEKIVSILKSIAEKETLRFGDLFEGAISRNEVIATFLALLELIRMRRIATAQSESFGEIEITRGEEFAQAASADLTAPATIADATTLAN